MPRARCAMLVFGTRPEAIKLAPVIRALRETDGWKPVVVVTGQHREMLDQVLSFFGIRPHLDLEVMRPNQALADLSAAVLTGVSEAIAEHTPDVVVVQGDTTSAVMAALAAFYLGIPTAHVEAGLRTYDKRSPFPEEVNRQIIGRVADLHFAPTLRAAEHLRGEGVDPTSIVVTGNTAIDALHLGLAILDADPAARDQLPVHESFERCGGRRLILVTGHRRENVGQGIYELCAALTTLADSRPDTYFLLPVHRNPNVRGPITEQLGGHPSIELVDPLSYDQFLLAMRRAYLIISDSGGIQEEAPSLGTPVLVTRDTTERPEAVEAGTARLIGCTRGTIIEHARELLDNAGQYAAMARAHNPFGDGTAAAQIAQALDAQLGRG